MKKIYIAPSTLSVELRAAKMMAVSLVDDETISSGNVGDYEFNAREDNNNTDDNNNRNSVWDNIW